MKIFVEDNFFLVEGKYNSAKVFSQKKNKKAVDQIRKICSNAAYKNSQIRVMPDYHPGLGSVIGFTATLEKRIVPNTVGVDINCGMLTAEIGDKKLDFKALDQFIRSNIPHGFKHRQQASQKIPQKLLEEITEISKKMDLNRKKQLTGIGSLGGGNHFIEVSEDKKEDKYLIIHSGSRNFGLQVCNYHQNKAYKYCQQKYKKVKDKSLKKEYDLSKSSSFLESEAAEEYYQDMKIAQKYADLNRKIMLEMILEFLQIEPEQIFQTRHNYINFDDKIIRKGAVSAHQGEKILIPLNMRDGSILAEGKGNEDWNYSAPHGAGRLMSRTQAKKEIDLEDFKKSMRDVYSTSVSKKTIDEAPFAYKSAEEILLTVKDSIEVVDILRPLYNFKSS